jgi:hypothetical protein
MEERADKDKRFRIAPSDEGLKELEQLAKIWRCKTLAVAVERLIDLYAGPTLRGLQKTQLLVETLPAKEVISTESTKTNGYHQPFQN